MSEIPPSEEAYFKFILLHLLDDDHLAINTDGLTGAQVLGAYGFEDLQAALLNCTTDYEEVVQRPLKVRVCTLMQAVNLLTSAGPDVTSTFARMLGECIGAVQQKTLGNSRLTDHQRANPVSQAGCAFISWLTATPPYDGLADDMNAAIWQFKSPTANGPPTDGASVSDEILD
ncbi:hypothetical protein NliqN6_6621 [Naganishia liquefaciens]|uniref:Uncharacterized protein n=1 Tax=Naganishia liquefaciens TaxID=104408 RepID=A0A8H3YHS7_9TREE|nr:hypothetical protein NliqN6_6621 [Naganishia liquefaciens]